jgi:HD-GYP domain-containing protein (c-di-GMP phosphodiesterase class II)
MAVQLDVANLPNGTKLRAPLFDNRNVKLLAPGITITQEIIQALIEYGITQVQIDEVDNARIAAFVPQGDARQVDRPKYDFQQPIPSRAVSRMAADLQNHSCSQLLTSNDPLLARIKSRGTEPLDAEFGEYIADRHEDRIKSMRESLLACTSGQWEYVSRLPELISQPIDDAIEDFDAAMILGINPSNAGYPIRHGCHAALLAMGIATQLGQDSAQVRNLMLGMIVHDWGMLKISSQILESENPLTSEDFNEIVKHPFHTLEILEDARQYVAPEALLVALEVHERCNGSGYPFRKTKAQTHYLSRIASVADAYTAMVTPRPHRSGLMPYYAIELMLRGVREGLYESEIVRALLYSISMFPVGSFVDLGEPYVGRVIRTRFQDYDRPVVEVWNANNLNKTPAIVDLTQTNRLRIVRPLAHLKS